MSKMYSASHYQHIDRVEREHFWFVGRNDVIVSLIRRCISDPNGKTFLDVGCGTGVLLTRLSSMGFSPTGLDINARALSYAKQHTKGQLVRSSIFQYHPNVHFDSIGAFDVMEHIQDDSGFLARCNTLLKSHGYMFLSVPADPYLWSAVDVSSGHLRRYTKDGLRNLFAESGFRIHYMGYWNSLLLPMYILWRRLAKDTIQTYLTQPNSIINRLLLWILHVEGLGRFPFGATLVVAAQKL